MKLRELSRGQHSWLQRKCRFFPRSCIIQIESVNGMWRFPCIWVTSPIMIERTSGTHTSTAARTYPSPVSSAPHPLLRALLFSWAFQQQLASQEEEGKGVFLLPSLKGRSLPFLLGPDQVRKCRFKDLNWGACCLVCRDNIKWMPQILKTMEVTEGDF